jgi:hypothetical protein
VAAFVVLAIALNGAPLMHQQVWELPFTLSRDRNGM